MPYEAVRDDRCPVSKPWGTVNANDRSLLGCHETQERALAQGRAAMAHESAKEDHMETDFKDVGVAELKVLDDEAGIVKAIVSVTNVVDNVNDNILPGAYEKTLAARPPLGCWAHNWDEPVAKTLEAVELMPGDPRLPTEILAAGGGGLLITAQFNLDGQRGSEAYKDVKFFGEHQQWSIGYKVPVGKSRVDKKTGVREIEEIDLFEFSPVLYGAAPLAGTVSIKSLAVDIAKELAQKDDPDAELIRAAAVAYLDLLNRLDGDKAPEDAPDAPPTDDEIEPHEFVDEDDDGRCDVCDLPEDECRAEYEVKPSEDEPVKVDEGTETKEGRVLSGANRAAVQTALDALQALLDASMPPQKSDDESETKAETATEDNGFYTIPEADLLRFEALKRV